MSFSNGFSFRYFLSSKVTPYFSSIADFDINLKSEFSNIAHTRGILSAARSADPNSDNSQFFICFDSAPHLDRQYSVFGKVIKGMEFIDMIKKGDPNSGAVAEPDNIISLRAK